MQLGGRSVVSDCGCSLWLLWMLPVVLQPSFDIHNILHLPKYLCLDLVLRTKRHVNNYHDLLIYYLLPSVSLASQETKALAYAQDGQRAGSNRRRGGTC